MIKLHRSFELEDFQLYLTTLDAGNAVPLIVTIPQGFALDGGDLGLNTNRANGVVSGTMEFSKVGVVGYSRTRGESPQDSRVAHSGEWFVKSLEDDSMLVCIIARNPTERFYDYALHPLAPGESVTLENSYLNRDVFVVQGAVTVDERVFSEVKHVRLKQSKDYVFTNHTGAPSFIVYVKEIPYEDAVALADELYPNRESEFGFITARANA